LLVVVVGVVGVWTLNPSRGGRVGGIVVPDQLRGRLLFFAEPGDTEIVRADGKVVQSLPQVAAVGYPIQPVVTAEHLVVFVHDGQAYRVGADLRGPLVQVGAADRLFPADGGDVGLQVGLSPSEPTFVEYMAADGTVPQHGTTSTQLPTGSTPVVRMPTGLLVLTSQNRLAFFPAGPSISVGPVRRVIGSFYVTVAWDASTGCASDGVSCPLHLTETAQEADRVISPPAGFGGFADGGAFSPDGSWLTAFVYQPIGDTPGLRMVLIDTHTGRCQVIGSALPAGEPIGSAAWSPDGKWVFFSGLTGPMYAEQIGPDGPIKAPVALPLPASYSFTPL